MTPGLVSNSLRGIGLVGLLVATAGCDMLIREPAEPVAVLPDPAAPRAQARLETEFALPAETRLIGAPQLTFARYEDTLSDIARAYNLGFEELKQANPGIDPWLPGTDSVIYLPTHFVIPDAPQQGLVLNVATLRLFYFPQAEAGRVITHPIGIGRIGWETPLGSATVVSKARNPTWYVPASIRQEHAEMGDPLPAVVPPGPDNPLGAFAIKLSMPGYLIHGTNQPYGVGMRVSHGCVRLYPENIDDLFEIVAVGEAVHIVNQPVLAAWQEGQLYLEVHKPLEEDQRDLAVEARTRIEAMMSEVGQPLSSIDWGLVEQVVSSQRGLPFPVSRFSPGPDHYLAAVTVVENIAPTPAAEPTAQIAPLLDAE